MTDPFAANVVATDTIEVEFLSPSSPRDRIARSQMNWAQLTRIALTRLRTQVNRIVLASGNRPKITNVTRAVFHSRFGEHEKDSHIARYWASVVFRTGIRAGRRGRNLGGTGALCTTTHG